jgi:hypothetical protein
MPASCCRNPLQMKRPRGVEPECIGPHDPPSTDAQKTTDVSSVSVALSRPVGRATLHVRRKRSHSLCTRATCRRSCRGWPVRYIGRLRERSAGWAARSVSFLTASPPSRTLTSSGQLVLARQAPWERLGGGTTFCGPPGWPLSCPFLEPHEPLRSRNSRRRGPGHPRRSPRHRCRRGLVAPGLLSLIAASSVGRRARR